MILSLSNSKSHKKSELLTGEVEHWVNDELIDNINKTGWYAIESGSRGECFDAVLLQQGNDDYFVNDFYLVDDDSSDEFKFIDISYSHVEIGHSEENGYALLHINV